MAQSFKHWVENSLSTDPEIAGNQERYAVRMGDNLLYGPQPKQALAHAVTEPNILYGGAMAGGKSHWMRWHFILAALAFPNFRGVILRRTYIELELSQLLAISVEVPPELAKWKAGEKHLEFTNGSIVAFGHCNTDGDFQRWLSSEWDMIGIDEAGTFTPWMLTILRTRLRTNKPDLMPQFALSSNPGGVGHLWLKSRFLDQTVPAEEDRNYDPELYAFVSAKVEDNAHVNPEYASFLDSLPDDERRAYREGDWDVFAGQYFRELRREIHSFEFPEGLPEGWREWKKFRSYDWGFAKPASMGFWVMDPDGNPFRCLELYQKGLEVEDFMLLVQEKDALFRNESDQPPRWEYTVADPSCWDSSHGPSKFERAMQAGVPMIPAERKSMGDRGVRVEGWSLMRRYVDPNSSPIIRVSLQCRDWWRTVPALVHDDKRVEDLDSDGEDHAADETRYFLTSRPAPLFVDRSRIEPQNPFEPGSLSWYAHDRFQEDKKHWNKVQNAKNDPSGIPEHPEFGEVW